MNEKECEALLILRDMIVMTHEDVREIIGTEPESLRYLRKCAEYLSEKAMDEI